MKKVLLKRVTKGLFSTKGKVYKAIIYDTYFTYRRDDKSIVNISAHHIGTHWRIVEQNTIGGRLL